MATQLRPQDGDLAGMTGNSVGLAESLKRMIRRNDTLNLIATRTYLSIVQPYKVKNQARTKGLEVHYGKRTIDVFNARSRISIAKGHAIYLNDVIGNFDYFSDAVEPDQSGVIDYSKPNLHRVKGFDLHPVRFPSLAEPTATTEQYLEFANLSEGSVALDLGAYSGLTSIMFRELCGASGRVIAVDADVGNITAIRENFAMYHEKTGRTVELLEGAVWTHGNGISFSSEGNMGSSAVEIVGNRVGAANLVPSFTLADIADRNGLERIDFIKCDIEGGEAVIFENAAFFERFRPRIIVEVHPIGGEMTTGAVQRALAPHGYRFRMIEQAGDSLPLMECWPD